MSENKRFIEELQAYADSLNDGDNITVTCDLLNAIDGTLEYVDETKGRNKIYTIVFEWSTNDSNSVDVEVFFTYEKAVERFNEIISNEKKPEMSWAADAFDENGNFITDEKNGYELDCSDFDNGEEHELWWRLSDVGDWYFHDNLELRILEVK